MESSTLFPKIQRNHMFPRRWPQPPWRNIEVKSPATVPPPGRHGLPSQEALLPVISYLGPALAAIITGSVVVEQIFGVPGLGRFFVQGALNRDYTLVMGVVVFYGIVIILLNFIVDLVYAGLNPRIRYDEGR